MRPLPILLTLLVLAACETSDPTATPAPGADTTTTAAPTSDADSTPPPGGPGVSLPVLVEAAAGGAPGEEGLPILDRLNPPRRVDAEPRPNRHVPGQIDTLRTLVYDGLRLTVYDVSGSGEELLQSIEVTSDAYATPTGLRVGSTRADVEAALGAPDRREDGAAVHTLGDGPTPPALHVRYGGDAVSSLAYRFYVD